jgi:tetratricopeptide (TPR) repeat protein
MSLLLEALKKAEKAKQEAQRRANADAQSAEPADGMPAATSPERQGVLTRDRLPDISAPLEILTDDLPKAPRATPAPELEPLEPLAKSAASAARSRTGAEPATDDAARATARKVFEAKFSEPNPRMPFYITVGVLGLFAVGTAVYFWYQLRPPSPLVNLNPPRNAEASIAAAPPPSPAPTPVAAATAPREPAIPGLPGSPAPAAAPRAPTRSPTPAIPAAPRETPRLAPAPASEKSLLAAAPIAEPRTLVSRRAPEVNPKVGAGYAAYVAGDMTKARAEYEDALRDEPTNRDALLGLGALDVRAGRYESAEALYLKVLQVDPRDPEAQAALLALRAGRSDPLATESRVKSMLAVDPAAHALNFTLGNQFAQQNRWAEAQQEYLKAFAAEPDNADFAYNVAVSFDHLHDKPQALEYYRRAITLARSRGASFDLASAQARAAQLAR